ncbi:MAG: pyruvate dehydrogenase (acetyl-transferring) E1 component subunit alpha [Chloroflexi bacterium]|nr:pyruvate dehydrogenase (acetyl-transferring) E1 component subunit alpha [Chloroflexota bacterium]
MQTAPRDAQLPVTREQGLEFLRQMLLIRRFEERAEQAYTEGKIGGFLHLYIGEEAIAVGAMAGLNADDDVVTHYRDHGYALARGIDPKNAMAELYGKATGICKGKGGSMHFADPKKHFWGGYAIVGGHIPLAVGLAFAAQYQNQPRVAVAIFGDGATNIGMFHESLNMAKVWNVPMIILVENNQYGMGTAVHRASAVPDMVTKALGYNIPAAQVDGNDVLAMRDAMMVAALKARRGEGPQFIEAKTYRFRGHSMGDPQRYRTKEEVEKMKARDPIVRFELQLVEHELATQDDFAFLRNDVDRVASEAVEFAETSPFPDPSELYSDVFAPEASNG